MTIGGLWESCLADMGVRLFQVFDGGLGQFLELGLEMEFQVFALDDVPVEVLVAHLVLAKPLLQLHGQYILAVQLAETGP
jgi:hypothetical protein